ncbi:MAG: 50S ribosomal protein L18 [Thermodesulfobacteriota bacterium]
MARQKRVKRIRKNISGTGECPRLRVFKSAKHIYAQLIDDVAGHTLATASTLENGTKEGKGKLDPANKVGTNLAKKAKKLGIEKVVFDRGGYIYHGRVKSLSEGAREGGLKF